MTFPDESTESVDAARGSYPFVPHVVVAGAIGAMFILALLAALILPGVAVVYFIVGFGIHGIVEILALWVLSVVVSAIGLILIQKTYIETVLRSRVLSKVPNGILKE